MTKLIIFTLFIMSIFCSCKKQEIKIEELQAKLETEFIPDYTDYTVKPILRNQKRIYIKLEDGSEFYATNFKYSNINKLLLAKDNSFSDLVNDQKTLENIFLILTDLYRYNLFSVSKRGELITFSTNIKSRSEGDYVLVFCKDSFQVNSLLLSDKKDELVKIKENWYKYTSSSYSRYDDIEDFKMGSLELILRQN